MSSLPGINTSSEWYPDLFGASDEVLTIENANKYFLRLSGGLISGSLQVVGGVDAGALSISGNPVLSQQAGILNLITSVRHGITLEQTNPSLSSNILFTAPTGVAPMEFGLRGSSDLNGGDIYIWKGGFRLTFANATNLMTVFGPMQVNGVQTLSISANNTDSLILNNGSGQFVVNTNTNNASVIGMRSNHALSFMTNGLVRGSVTPAGLFDWAGDVRAINYTSVSTANDTTVFQNTNGTCDFRIKSFSNATTIGCQSNHGISFVTNNLVRMQIAPTGVTECIGNFTAPQVTSRYIKNIFNGGTNTDVFLTEWGSETQPRSRWFWYFRQPTANQGSYISLTNNSTDANIKIGTGLNSAQNRGCLMVLTAFGDPEVLPVDGSGVLHINGGCNVSIPSNRRYGPLSSDPSNQAGGSVPVSLFCNSAIWITNSMYATSDRRMKTDIRYLEDINDTTMRGILNLKPCFYRWKKSPDTIELGLIAQDIVKEGLSESGLVQLFENKECDSHCEETDTPKGQQFVVDYTKLPLYLLEVIKRQQKQIEAIVGLLPPKKREAFNQTLT